MATRAFVVRDVLASIARGVLGGVAVASLTVIGFGVAGAFDSCLRGMPMGAAVGGTSPSPILRQLDPSRMADEIQQTLRGSYRIEASRVWCPASEQARVGNRFNCIATVAGEPHEVLVTVLSTDGRYQINRPR